MSSTYWAGISLKDGFGFVAGEKVTPHTAKRFVQTLHQCLLTLVLLSSSLRHTMQWSFGFSLLATYLTPNYQALHELDQVLGEGNCARLLVPSLKCSLRTLWIVLFLPNLVIFHFSPAHQVSPSHHSSQTGRVSCEARKWLFFPCITAIHWVERYSIHPTQLTSPSLLCWLHVMHVCGIFLIQTLKWIHLCCITWEYF